MLYRNENAWHALCNRGTRQRKTFESRDDADRISKVTQNMKPTLQSPNTTSRNAQAFTRRGSSMPQTDYHYQHGSLDFGSRCKDDGRPSFRAISEEYLSREARRDFVSEATFFAAIVITAAVPVLQSAYGLARLIGNSGLL